jgi:AraC-like DNA-binding protein
MDFGRPRVVTVLTPAVRDVIDCAASDGFDRVHVDTIAEASSEIYGHGATTLLLSTQRITGRGFVDMARTLRQHPAVTPVVVLAEDWPTAHETLLEFGARGVKEVVNLAERNGWERLRTLIMTPGGECTSVVTRDILGAAQGASDEMRHFLGKVIVAAPRVSTVQVLSTALQVEPSTLMSRFFRASLPAPKLYLAMTRLLYAAWLLERPGVSIAATANALHFSSPQSFGRNVRTLLGLTTGEFRRELPFTAAVDHYRQRLLQPYEQTLSTFRPVALGG